MDNKKRVEVGLIIQRIWANMAQGTLYIELARAIDGLPAQDLVELIGSIAGAGHAGREAIWGVLRAALDRQLVSEHVAAQEKMSSAADEMQKASLLLARESNKLSRRSNALTWATVVLAVVAAIETGVQVWQGAHSVSAPEATVQTHQH